MSGRPQVSLCMIVRNEEKNLAAVLEPVGSLVDEIIVVDTGSVDATKRVAADLKACVFDFPWRDDFAAARNESLRRAAGEWIFWLDADDRLDTANLQRLRELMGTLGAEPVAYHMACVSETSSSALVLSQCRLFRNHADLRWERRVHEQINPSIERAGHRVVFSNVEIRHLGYQDPTLSHRKANRDLRLLRLEYATNPTDPFTLFNLGTLYMRLGQPAEALTYLLNSVKYLTNLGDWVRRLYAILCDALMHLGRLEEALAITQEGVTRFPNDPVLMTRRGDLLARAGDLGGAERCLVQFLSSPLELDGNYGEKSVLDRREARRQLGLIYYDQGRLPEAERVFQELLASFPTFIPGWVGLGYVFLRRRRYSDLEHASRQLEKCDFGTPYALVLRAESHIARGDMTLARELLDEAIAKAPHMAWPRIVLGDWMMKVGADLAQCIAIQRDLLRMDPCNMRAAENLRLLLQKQRGVPEASPLGFTMTVEPWHLGTK